VLERALPDQRRGHSRDRRGRRDRPVTATSRRAPLAAFAASALVLAIALALVPWALAEEKGTKKDPPKGGPNAKPSAAARAAEVLLSGLVIDPDYKPVRAQIEVLVPDRPDVRVAARLTADAKGAFTLRRSWLEGKLPPDVTDCVVVFRDPRGKLAPGGAHMSRESAFNMQPTVRLARGATPSVIVTAEGKPVAGAVVLVYDDCRWGAVATDARGTVKVGPVPADDARFLVFAEGFVPARVDATDLKDGARVEVALSRGATIAGRILDPEGKPLARAVVGVYRGDPFQSLTPLARWVEEALAPLAWTAVHGDDPFVRDPGARRRGLLGRDLLTAISGEDGAFALAGVPRGARLVVALHARHATASMEVSAPTSGPLELTLGRGGTITGTARRLDGRPATGAVLAATAMGPAMKVARVRPDGTYEIQGLVARDYSVSLTDDATYARTERVAGRGFPSERRFGVTVGEGETVVVDFGGGACLQGKVRSMKPIPMDAVIILARKDDPDDRARWQRSPILKHDPEARYEFAEVKPGRYVLAAFIEVLNDPFNPAATKSEERLVPLGEVEVKEGEAQVTRDLDLPDQVDLK